MTDPAWTIHTGDCLDIMRGMESNSVDAIITDPPYFRVKAEAWDRQWTSADRFLAWIDEVAEQWQRILKPNGSLYCFASPRMAARVEVTIGRRFEVLNGIVWHKDFHGRHSAASKETLRAYFPNTERIIFAEHFGADNIAKGEAGYVAKCDELRGFVFEPLRAYLDGERINAGFDRKMCDEACGNQMAGHYFSRIQWTLPTRANYEKLRAAFNRAGSDHLRRESDHLRREYDDLRREYDDLRREYDHLRRPFTVTRDVPYTDVWTFPTVPPRPGKHPCEKPVDMLRHMVKASTRPGAVVLDCFAGSGSTGEACRMEGRMFIGIEKDPAQADRARARLKGATADVLPLFAAAP